jgi:ubiquinone/menaquinone biosynthesis C-methylase UbiE
MKKSPKQSAVGSEWWATHFDSHYLREYEPIFDLENDRREIGRLIEIMQLPVGARILDVPCGQGRHAHLLAEAGYSVEGVDYSKHLIDIAKKRGTSANLHYTRGDMRNLPAKWRGKFDAVVNLFTSFGFFVHPREDAKVIKEFARVLKPGGIFVFHGGSRDGVMARFLAKDWWTTSDGTFIGQQREFDPLSGKLTVHSTWKRGAKQGTRTHHIRLYTATRLAELCSDAGLIVEQAFDGWADRLLWRKSSEMLLVARHL